MYPFTIIYHLCVRYIVGRGGRKEGSHWRINHALPAIHTGTLKPLVYEVGNLGPKMCMISFCSFFALLLCCYF